MLIITLVLKQVNKDLNIKRYNKSVFKINQFIF